MKGGEKLARPGVVSAGKQSSFREDKVEVPSAFGDDDDTDGAARRCVEIAVRRNLVSVMADSALSGRIHRAGSRRRHRVRVE